MGEALAALEAGGPAALVTLAESAEDEGAHNGRN
jgi:N-acetylmuramic acid 6-phosphate (MurNAc-6-P) etherase